MESIDTSFIPVASPIIGDKEIEYVTDAVRSGWVSSMGPYIDRFEHDFAAHTGVKHAIALANGTVSLHLAYHALGIGSGHEIIIPDLTFAATVHAALQTGATPVLVDVDSDSWCLDPACVEKAITPKTKAIVAVHLYGHPANMDALRAIADKHSIELLEDAAEAHGADINGARVGSLSRVGAFSFYGNKTITTGEGGALTTNDDALAQRIRFLKDHGMSKSRRYFHTELAFNYRMTNLQAALGVAQIEQLDTFVEKKRTIMKWYRRELEGLSCVKLNPELPGCHSTFWMISALLDSSLNASRDEVCAKLREHNIDTRPFFVPMSQMPHLKDLRQVGRNGQSCPVSCRLSERGINLPSGCSLTEQQVVRACKSLRAILE